jgi:hypothetical protein
MCLICGLGEMGHGQNERWSSGTRSRLTETT